MKKISIYYLLLCVALMVASCVEPLTPQPKLGDGSFGINLSVSCKSPDTKTLIEGPTNKPGENIYNENTLNRIDWFIFKTGNNAAVKHGRIVAHEDTVVNLNDVVGSATSLAGTVYVIANLPESLFKHETSGTNFQFKEYKNGSWSTVAEGDLTKDYLKSLSVVASFNKLSNGKFKAQDDFVMTGFDENANSFNLTSAAPAGEVEAKLTRLASKVTMDLSVIPVLDEVITLPNGQKTYTKTWYPNLDEIQVYLSFVDSAATLTGDPEVFAYDTDFFTYNRYGFIPKYSFTGDTHDDPQPVFPPLDYSSEETTTPEKAPEWDNSNWEWKVTGSPFYTYPVKWETSSPNAPFIKIILPWTSFEEDYNTTTGVATRTHYGEPNESTKRLFYYKIPLPSYDELTEGNNKLQSLQRNKWYNLVVDVAILGGSSDDLPLQLAGQYYVVDWNTPGFTAGGDLKQGRYLSTAVDTFHIYGGPEIEIPVSSSHTLSDEGVIIKREILYNDQWRETYTPASQNERVPNQVTNLQTRPITVTVAEDGRSFIKFENQLLTEMNSNLDCYRMRFTLKLRHSDGQGPVKTIVIYQDPPIYIEKKTGGNVMVDGYYGNVDSYYQAWQPGGSDSPTLNSFQNNKLSYQNGLVTVTFGGSFAYESTGRMRADLNPNSGTITVTAPDGVTITQVAIGYRNQYGAQNYSWTPTGTSSSTTNWQGSAQEVTASLSRNNTTTGNRLTVTSVRVYYTSTSGGPGASGSSGTQEGVPVRTPYAPVTRYTNSQVHMTVITISSLGNNSEYTRYYDRTISTNNPADSTRHKYLIADPRQIAGYSSNDLEPYWSRTEQTTVV